MGEVFGLNELLQLRVVFLQFTQGLTLGGQLRIQLSDFCLLARDLGLVLLLRHLVIPHFCLVRLLLGLQLQNLWENLLQMTHVD